MLNALIKRSDISNNYLHEGGYIFPLALFDGLYMHVIQMGMVWDRLKVKVKKSRATPIALSQSYGMSLAIWDRTVLPSTLHKWTHPAITPARGQYSIYLPRRDGRLSWPRWLVTYWDGLPAHRFTHPSTNLTVHSRELNSWPVDHKSDALTTTLPCHQLHQ